MLIMFDVLGTVVDMSSADKADIKAYINHIKQPLWSPLVLPKSWESFPAFPDAIEGLAELRKHHTVVTCSNPPLGFLARLSKNAGLTWDAIVPLELAQVYKTNLLAYLHVMYTMGFVAKNTVMVTSNEKFGDLEATAKLGIKPILIDRENKYKYEYHSIVELAQNMR